jgi:beta-glucosidase
MTSTASNGVPNAQPSGASLSFPPGFVWGAATAAYQIEGAAHADGRGQSVWDTFSHTPGKVRRGDTGDIACDSYHRYPEDVALMKSLGLSAYRFSVSWPRIQPGGSGAGNEKGLDYYRALLDELAANDIAAAATLFHWDLPQELQDAGGWANRDTALRFADYATIVVEALGDRVARWITLNEPQVVAENGYRIGHHAPGLTDYAAAAATNHHLLLGHGLATQALRAGGAAEVGITLDMHPVRVFASPDGAGADGAGADGAGADGHRSEELEQARRIVDADLNGLYLQPLLQGSYPTAASADIAPPQALIKDGDLATICQPLDFLGINYYAPIILRAGDPDDLRRNEHQIRGGVPGVVGYAPETLERTPMGWLIDPEGLYELLLRLSQDAPGLPLYVTENGCAAEDYVDPEGNVNDVERISYLHQHLDACARAIKDGVNLAGYYVWSLLDNFEWGWGYQKRFGIVFVDFGTQRRIPKSSAHFYSDVIKANALPELAGPEY